MEVYREIKKDLLYLFWIITIISVIISIFDYRIDDTDKDGFNRSGVQLITDYGTGKQYLYKNGALLPRIGKDGKHKTK
jgi:hypothetical protein